MAKRTTVRIYRNKVNRNKYLEIHNDGYYHNRVVQYMHWENGVKNTTKGSVLWRWKKANLDELLKDYELVDEYLFPKRKEIKK